MTPSLRHEAAAWRGAGGSAVEPARCRRVTDASLAFCGRRRRPPGRFSQPARLFTEPSALTDGDKRLPLWAVPAVRVEVARPRPPRAAARLRGATKAGCGETEGAAAAAAGRCCGRVSGCGVGCQRLLKTNHARRIFTD